MNIYDILASKPHNPHYLKRYIRFIKSCQNNSFQNEKYFESHHICPKSKDLFPEFSSFKIHSWNEIVLPARHHYIAHLLLWKSFGGNQTKAFIMMTNIRGVKNSRLYEVARQANSIMMSSKNPNFDGRHSKKAWESATADRHQQQSETATKRNRIYWSDPKNREKLSQRNIQKKFSRSPQYFAKQGDKEILFHSYLDIAKFIKEPKSTVYKYIKTGKLFDSGWQVGKV